MSETFRYPADAGELLVVVNDDDEIVGYERKDRCHDGRGILHRAISAYLVTPENQVLIQRRSERKRLWPLFWSNSCCGHPGPGEESLGAALRRVREELGVSTSLEFAFKYRYEAAFGSAGSENEYCYVYLGLAKPLTDVNPAEVADWRLVDAREMDRELVRREEVFTPWFRLGWQRLRAERGAPF